MTAAEGPTNAPVSPCARTCCTVLAEVELLHQMWPYALLYAQSSGSKRLLRYRLLPICVC